MRGSLATSSSRKAEYVKITDINGNMSHRLSKNLNMGQMLAIAIKDNRPLGWRITPHWYGFLQYR